MTYGPLKLGRHSKACSFISVCEAKLSINRKGFALVESMCVQSLHGRNEGYDTRGNKMNFLPITARTTTVQYCSKQSGEVLLKLYG